MSRGISFGTDKSKSDLMHNTREYVAKNVDPARIKDDVILKRETLQEAYESCFGQATAEYNAKQKRKDRKIDDYFENLFGVSADDKQKTRNVLINKDKCKSYYENLVQIGDMFNTNCVNDPQTAKLAKNALITYVNGDPRLGIKSYAERNPQFYVFDASIHMDESTPHLHLCYIPVATSYQRGMKCQNGHDKALKQMGYERHTDYVEREREIFREICKSYGLEPREKGEEKGRGHTYSVKEYKANAEQIREADKKLREADMPAVAPTEPEKHVEAPERSYRSHKQAGKQKPVETPTKTSTGITRFNYYAEKQKNMQEMVAQQREREQQAEALYNAGYDNDIEATTLEA